MQFMNENIIVNMSEISYFWLENSLKEEHFVIEIYFLVMFKVVE